MKKNLPVPAFLVVALLVSQHLTAQSKQDVQTLLPPPHDIKIDGDLKDWGDSLRFYNAEKKINFSLANDTGNLYIAVRINDKKDQMHMLMAGFTLSIDTKGRKKETYRMTFPAADPNAAVNKLNNADLQNTSGRDQDEPMQARLTKLRTIRVEGFKEVESETMTTSNTYGFKAAVDMDADGYLVYEAAIPMRFLHADNAGKNEWAFNFKINGLSRPDNAGKAAGEEGGMGERRGGGRGGMGGGGRGGMGGGRGGMGGGRGGNHPNDESSRGELSKSTDFWEKFYLAR
jgi:hypothetical protein